MTGQSGLGRAPASKGYWGHGQLECLHVVRGFSLLPEDQPRLAFTHGRILNVSCLNIGFMVLWHCRYPTKGLCRRRLSPPWFLEEILPRFPQYTAWKLNFTHLVPKALLNVTKRSSPQGATRCFQVGTQSTAWRQHAHTHTHTIVSPQHLATLCSLHMEAPLPIIMANKNQKWAWLNQPKWVHQDQHPVSSNSQARSHTSRAWKQLSVLLPLSNLVSKDAHQLDIQPSWLTAIARPHLHEVIQYSVKAICPSSYHHFP